MTKEQEEKMRKFFDGKDSGYIVQSAMLLKMYANHEHPEYENMLEVMNQLILESMQPK